MKSLKLEIRTVEIDGEEIPILTVPPECLIRGSEEHKLLKMLIDNIAV